MDTAATTSPWHKALAQCVLKYSDAGELAKSVEAHLSPELRGQLLEADLALGNALRELVDIERAKFNLSALARMELGKASTRTSLYPERTRKAGEDPAYSGAVRMGERSFSIRAWIGANQEFINIELSIL